MMAHLVYELRAARAALATFAVVAALSLSAPALAQSGPTPKAADKASSKKRVVLDRVVAVVNNQVILASELDQRILPLSAELSSITDKAERARRRRKLIGQILDEMIHDELIVQAARDAQLTVEPKEIKAALDDVKKQNNLDDAGLEQALAMQGFSLTSYKKEVERQLLRIRATNVLVRPRVTITDEDVRAAYDERTRRSSAISKVYLQHIVVSVPKRPSDRQLAAAKDHAADIINQARSGKDFSELARAYSDDEATRASGGDLGWFERGSLPTDWERVVFSMNKGEVRGPINGPTGLHIFYVKDIEKTDIQPFDKLKTQLRNELYKREMNKQTGLWLDELRKKAYIERKL